MKKIYFLFLLGLINVSAFAQSPFTTGNLVVLRVGDGSAALTSASTATYLDEYTPAGVLVQSIALSSATDDKNSLTSAGSSTSEGQITKSSDNTYILVTGYGIKTGIAAIATGTNASADTPRVVALIDKNVNIDLTTRLTDAYSRNNIRGVASTNGTDIWVSGNSSTTGGVRYTTKGGTTTVQLSTTPTNVRALGIFNGQLYVTSASSPFFGVAAVGTGLPTTSGQTTTLLSGFPTTASSPSQSPYAFAFNSAGDVLYVADDRAIASGGGIQKWTLSGGTWTLAYTIATAPFRGLAVDWSTTNPTLYATASAAIYKIVDEGASSTGTSIVTAATNTGFRGLVFAPEVLPSPVRLKNFDVQKSNNTVQATWSTEQEINSDYFVIQRSVNGTEWKDVTRVNAAGTSSTTLSYSGSDLTPANGLNLYRLKQVNKEGQITYSTTKKVLFSNTYKVLVSPNPVKDVINVFVSKNNNESVKVKVIDGTGKVVRSAVSNQSQIQISAEGLSKGVYAVKIFDNNNVTTQKILVQ